MKSKTFKISYLYHYWGIWNRESIEGRSKCIIYWAYDCPSGIL